MAIIGTGVDLERVPAIERAIARHGERFLQRIFTPAEVAYCAARARGMQSFTARFAAKEAFRKAVGAPPGIRWRDIEVARAPSGQPSLRLYGKAAEVAAARGVTHSWLSLSHSGDFAIAMVTLEREGS